MTPKVSTVRRDFDLPHGQWALHVLIPGPDGVLAVLGALDHPALSGEYDLGEDAAHPGHMLAHVYFDCDHPPSLVPVAEAIAKQAYATAATTDTFLVSPSRDYADVQTTIDFGLVTPNG